MGVPTRNSGDRRRTVALTLTMLLVTLLVGACAGSATLSTVGGPIGNGTTQPMADGGVTSEGPAAVPAPAASAGPAGQSGNGYVQSAPRDDLKIVYTGSLNLVVDDLQTALAKARTAVEAVGGYIGASQESNDGDKPVATITYRIPASRWEDVIGSLRGVAAKVVSEKTQATEVGGQLVDLDARIRNLQASEASLQEIAKGAGKISDLLKVEAQLTDVRGQIEQLQGQQAHLQDQVAYGTLVTTFGLEVQQVVETAKGWDPSGDVDAASATLIGIGQTVASGLIWFGIVWLPLLLVVLLVAFVAFRLLRRLLPVAAASGPVAGWDGS